MFNSRYTLKKRVLKTEVEDVAEPRLAAKMMLGVLGIKT